MAVARSADTGRRLCRSVVAVLLSLGWNVPSQARPPESALTRCIAHEAAGRPWLEKTLWGLHDQEGGWIGAEIPAGRGTFDLGPMQINSQWVPRLATLTGHPDAVVRSWLINDACFNVASASWIFLTALTIEKDYWRAVGVYHSPTLWRQQRYIQSVSGHLRRRYGGAAFASTVSTPAASL